MTRWSGRILRAAVRAGVAALVGVAGWYGYHFPDQLSWLPVNPGLPGLVAVGAFAVSAVATRLGWHRATLAYGPVPTPRGERPGIVARLRAGAVAVQLAALATVPAVTGLVVGVNLARERSDAVAVAGLLGVVVSLAATLAIRRIVQRGLTVGITGDGIRLGGYFVPWNSVHRVKLVGRTITMELKESKGVQPPLPGLLPKIMVPAALLRVPAEPLVAAMKFYRRNPDERTRLAYPYPDGSPVILP
jgi:hypothetical protein